MSRNERTKAGLKSEQGADDVTNSQLTLFRSQSVADLDYLALPERQITNSDLLKNKGKSKSHDGLQKPRPLFIAKLWSMVNDTSNAKNIFWASDGESFIVKNRDEFMSLVLPKYFKHSNFSSFVRQLNMYGWHKISDVNPGLESAADDDIWQFKNPYFLRDHEELLDNIVRNKNTKHSADGEELDVDSVVNELNRIRSAQLAITKDLKQIRSNSTILWQEMLLSHERHDRHNDALQSIIGFISTMFGSNGLQYDRGPGGTMFQKLLQYQHQIAQSRISKPPESESVTLNELSPHPSSDLSTPTYTNRYDVNSSQTSIPNVVPAQMMPTIIQESPVDIKDDINLLHGEIRRAPPNANDNFVIPEDNYPSLKTENNYSNLKTDNTPDFTNTIRSNEKIVSPSPLHANQVKSIIDHVDSPLNLLEESMNRQEKSINNLNNVISRYMPEYDGPLLNSLPKDNPDIGEYLPRDSTPLLLSTLESSMTPDLLNDNLTIASGTDDTIGPIGPLVSPIDPLKRSAAGDSDLEDFGRDDFKKFRPI